ncbi:MAG TPA: cyclase family protein [Cyclobacteriaceae bacterium]|nr:cyclase family protein [Cyclobacteriaceae bacterium]
MITSFNHNNLNYKADLKQPIDISIPLQEGDNNPNCYGAKPVVFETIKDGNFIGSVAAGGSVNYQRIMITPHGNGTHTECIGHITAKGETINQSLKAFHFFAKLISITPEKKEDDMVITLEQIEDRLKNNEAEALVIRTQPNTSDKQLKKYSGTNPPYLQADATAYLLKSGIKHLLVDLPSIDKEIDGGKLAAHKAFWGFPDKVRTDASITELIYVPNEVADGYYLLNIQLCSLEADAAPSKPVLYKLQNI